MGIKEFIGKLLGTSDEISSKRVVGVVAFLVVVITAFVDLFTDYLMSPYIFDGLMYIVLGCFFFNVLETYSKRTPSSTVNVNKIGNVQVDAEQPLANAVVEETLAPEGDPAFDANNTGDILKLTETYGPKDSTKGTKR